jgi:hypothetical protein
MSMTKDQKIFMSCGIMVALALCSVVVMIGGCGVLLYKGVKDYPAWAKGEVINPVNKDVTDRIDKMAAESSAPDELRNKIRAEAWPTKVLYIGLQRDSSEVSHEEAKHDKGLINVSFPNEWDNGDVKDAYKPTPFSSHSTFYLNGNGYGSLGTPDGAKEIAIIDRQVSVHDKARSIYITLRCLIYIEHKPEKAAP